MITIAAIIHEKLLISSIGSVEARGVCSLSREYTTQCSLSDGLHDLTMELQLGAELRFVLMKQLLFRACSLGNGCKTSEEQDATLPSA